MKDLKNENEVDDKKTKGNILSFGKKAVETEKTETQAVEESKDQKVLTTEKIQETVEKVESEKPKKRKYTKRKSKAEKLQEEKDAENEKMMDAIFKSSLSLAIINITGLVSHFLDDKKWIAEKDEAQLMGESLVACLDYHFPNWKLASPDLALATAIFGYVSKRLLTDSKNDETKKR